MSAKTNKANMTAGTFQFFSNKNPHPSKKENGYGITHKYITLLRYFYVKTCHNIKHKAIYVSLLMKRI